MSDSNKKLKKAVTQTRMARNTDSAVVYNHTLVIINMITGFKLDPIEATPIVPGTFFAKVVTKQNQ